MISTNHMKKILALVGILVLTGWGCSSQGTVTTNSTAETQPQTTTTETQAVDSQDKASLYLDQSQEGITVLEELGVK